MDFSLLGKVYHVAVRPFLAKKEMCLILWLTHIYTERTPTLLGARLYTTIQYRVYKP